MLAECREHGYYRAEVCPECGREGKFLMNDNELDSLGRILAGVLRHFPEKIGLTMDGHGWVEISSFLKAIAVSRSGFQWLRTQHIEAVIETDLKGRYQIDGGMIRATYGHSIDVNLDDLPLAEIDEFFYPVAEEELEIILENGLHPVDRKKVHLSGSIEKALEAGRVRAEDPLIIRIDGAKARKDGVQIFHAGKDVYVTETIDAKFLSKVEESEIKKLEEKD